MIRISTNRMYLTLTAIALLAITCCTGFAQTISEEQAAEAVRAFENNPNLQFSDIFFNDNSDSSFPRAAEYNLDTRSTDLDLECTWTVDAVTGLIISVLHFDAYPHREDTDTPYGEMTKEDCFVIAEEYMQTHYGGFGKLNLIPEEIHWGYDGWDADWRETLPCGAVTPNYVSVTVNPETGEVQSYSCSLGPTPNPPDPQITSDQAYAIAVNAVNLENPVCEDGPCLFADAESIRWSMWLTEGGSLEVIYMTTVDAVTGEVKIDRMVAACAPVAAARRVPMPALQKRPALRWLRHEMSRVRNFSLEWLGHGTVRVVKAGHKFVLRNGSSNFTFDGKQAKLSRKAEIVRGRFMVPSDFGFSVVKMIAKSSKKGTIAKQPKIKSPSKK